MNSGLSKDGKQFVEGIVTYLRRDGKKVSVVPKVQTLLSKISTQAKEGTVAYVESPVPLTAEEKRDVEMAIARAAGHDMSVSVRINKELIAGLRIKIADLVIDTSYVSRLSEMAALLMR